MSHQQKPPQAARLTIAAAQRHRRDILRAGLAGGAALAVGLQAPAVRGQAKPFAGVTLNGAAFQSVFHEYLKDLLPEFEEQTGMKVNFDQQAFPVYNQRMDLELSTKGSAYDVCNVTFIYTGRWIGAGWLTPLDDFCQRPEHDRPDWDPTTSSQARRSACRTQTARPTASPGKPGRCSWARHGATCSSAPGWRCRRRSTSWTQVCEAIDEQEGVAAFVADKLHHWNWIPYLMGFGGGVFRDPPTDLLPTLDTAEPPRRPSTTPDC